VLPSPRQAKKGIDLALANAMEHIRAADMLAAGGLYGAAKSHVILAVEEAVKARVLFKWPALKRVMTERQLRDLLYHHPTRHEIAQIDHLPRGFRTRLALWHIDNPGRGMDRRTFVRLLSRFGDTFPASWGLKADAERQRGFHVDWNGRRWLSPDEVTEDQFRRRYRTCHDFVVKTLAALGFLDEMKGDLAEMGWDITEDRWQEVC
jgi:AbiV family abortive infection protein